VEGEGEGKWAAINRTKGGSVGGEAEGGAGRGSGADKKDGEVKERQEKNKKGEKGETRAEAGGSAQNSTVEDRHSTEEEEDQPRTVERRIYRRQKTRKLRKLNDGGKLIRNSAS
jgi:hypothetical protein